MAILSAGPVFENKPYDKAKNSEITHYVLGNAYLHANPLFLPSLVMNPESAFSTSSRFIPVGVHLPFLLLSFPCYVTMTEFCINSQKNLLFL
jgi:hypothetical protein